MTFQILTLYLKPDVHLTGKQQEPTCRQALSAISKQLKPTALYQITFKASATKIDVLIGLQPTVTSLEVSTSSTLLEPMFSYSECLPYIKYLTAHDTPETVISTNADGFPCDILTLRFPPSTPFDRQQTCLRALDYLLLASENTEAEARQELPYVGRIAGFVKEEFGVAGGDALAFKAYIMWQSPEKEDIFKTSYGGRYLLAQLDDVDHRQWKDNMGFYDALEEIWATEGVSVESGWIKPVPKVDYMSRSARAFSNAKAWISSSGGGH